MEKLYSLVGAGGYIAPRHMKAINDTGGRLVSAMDPFESVGMLDRYSQDVKYFKSFEELQFYNLHELDRKIDYFSICSPNHLHKPHIAAGLSLGANVICEKPLVLTKKDLETLKQIEKGSAGKVYTVLQLRVHEAIKALKKKLAANNSSKLDVDLCYMTSRGPWYHETWKANERSSGGLPTNIGIHFFDMLMWLFGDVEKSELHIAREDIFGGYIELEHARVRWVLSIDQKNLPRHAKEKGMTTYRSITIEGEEIEFSGGFTDLHTEVYRDILNGNGYGLDDAAPAVILAEKIRHQSATGLNQNSHPIFNEHRSTSKG